MKREIIICDQCKKAEVKAGGYLANMLPIGKTMVSMSVTLYGSDCDPDGFEHAFCGKECLMRRVNAVTDELEVLGGDAGTSAARVQQTATQLEAA